MSNDQSAFLPNSSSDFERLCRLQKLLRSPDKSLELDGPALSASSTLIALLTFTNQNLLVTIRCPLTIYNLNRVAALRKSMQAMHNSVILLIGMFEQTLRIDAYGIFWTSQMRRGAFQYSGSTSHGSLSSAYSTCVLFSPSHCPRLDPLVACCG